MAYVIAIQDRYVQSYDIASDITTTTIEREQARKFDDLEGAETIATFVGGEVKGVGEYVQ